MNITLQSLFGCPSDAGNDKSNADEVRWSCNPRYSLNMQTLGLLVALAQLAACATVVRGTTEKLDVVTSVDGKPLTGASCEIKRGQERWVVATPGNIEIARAKEDLHVRCTKDGYRMPTEADIKSDSAALASAGGGALGGAAVGAATTGLALFPVLAIPGAGWVIWPVAVGGGALIGGTTSAVTDSADGAAYSYPTPINIPMKRVAPQTANPEHPQAGPLGQ